MAIKSKINLKVVIWAIVGIISLVLSYLVHWSFLIVTLVAFIINQRELMKSSK
jgi:hypothetical protein